jgi:deazaflavin-dependent oxidoreductase (nitroreductase family)
MAMPREPLMPAWLPRVNERIVNPVQRLWAPWLPPWALIEHTGRRSGASRRTPVLAWKSGDALFVVLFYGPRTQWIRNLEAAGGGVAVRAGRRRAITGTRLVRDAAALPAAPAFAARRGLPVLVLELGQRA